PVRFSEAVAAAGADVFIEIGPGRILTDFTPRAIALDACGNSIRPLLDCVATLFESGASLDLQPVFANRFVRPFRWERPRFIANACGVPAAPEAAHARSNPAPLATGALPALLDLIARHTHLPIAVLPHDSRMLADLHLSSLTIARIVGAAAKTIGASALADPTLFANATIAEPAAVLEEMRERGNAAPSRIDGIADWARAFEVVDVAVPRTAPRRDGPGAWFLRGAEWPELRARLASVAGRGTVAILPSSDHIATLLETAKQVRDGETFVVVQTRAFGGAFARTLRLERPRVAVRVVDIPSLTNDACEWIAREIGGD